MAANTFDRIIIGAGFAGLSAAYHFSLLGERVVVLDRGSGKDNASFASTAEMNHDPDVNWDKVIAVHGLEAAKDIWQLTEKAIVLLTAFAHREGSEHFEAKRVPAHMFSTTAEGRSAIEHKYGRYRALGAKVTLESNPHLLHPSFKAALTLVGDGRTNNQAILRTLRRAVKQNGGMVYHQREVEHIEPGSPVHVHTSHGEVLSARRVLVATGDQSIPKLKRFPIERQRTYVVRYESPRLAELYRTAMMWDVAEPFHYIRSFAGRQLWVGGEDARADSTTKHTESQALKRLHEFSKEVLRLDRSYTPTGHWSGVFFPTARSLPYIIPADESGIGYSIGFGGSGLLMSFVSGYLQAKWAKKQESHYQHLFADDRR
ncbi:MAG: FAD-dependent oxidoreductase [Patescibacteria group bacterium]